MKICGISDLHGKCPDLIVEPCDVLFICGDIVPLRMQRNVPQSFSWFRKEFIPWCNKQPVDKIYMVGGNHDFFLVNEAEAKEHLINTNVTLLYNESAEYMDNNGKVWTIWGTPLCHLFGNWAFMNHDDYNKTQYEKMPENVDFLITHDAAFENSDQCLGFKYQYDRHLHRGNIALKEVIDQKHPKYHLFGHLHTCDHNMINYNGINTVCVSLLDEEYNRAYDPFYLCLE